MTIVLKDFTYLSISDIAAYGLSDVEARDLCDKLNIILRYSVDKSGPSVWQRVYKKCLLPHHPLELHEAFFWASFSGWDESRMGPPPAWIPTVQEAALTNLGRCLEAHSSCLLPGYTTPAESFPAFQRLSVEKPEVYWPLVFDAMDIEFPTPPSVIFEESPFSPSGRWLPGAHFNSAALCLWPSRSGRRRDEQVAVVWQHETEADGEGDGAKLHTLTRAELRAQACVVANALMVAGLTQGDCVAIVMPMGVEAVSAYLGVVLAGCVVVSVAESFAPEEIKARLHASATKLVITQDVTLRGAKALPLYNKVLQADAPHAIVLSAGGQSAALQVELRDGDIPWLTFTALALQRPRPEEFNPVLLPADSPSNILFSSGTTGPPKAIPWSHTSPLKCGSDAWAHQDVRPGDVVAWPSSLGWMMGPWLVYAALLNGAAMALFVGSPLGRPFAKFVQDAGVTMLGVVPSLVRSWRRDRCTEGRDWSRIRCFSSTGEASSPQDCLWLMAQATYRPIIEYCGGTEIAGAFATGTLLQPQALACFSTPAMGCRMLLLDEGGQPIPEDEEVASGECALHSAMLGSSSRLLNADHFAVYFKNMPTHNGKVLRRHGDAFERVRGGFYKALGRVDDTMNLGGIKVGSAEIERICAAADARVLEVAAIGVPPPGGGPEELLVVAVLKEGEGGGLGTSVDTEALQRTFSKALQQKLNPLFKVKAVALAPSLPRTASNKVMRRLLRKGHSSISQQQSLATATTSSTQSAQKVRATAKL
eukprot:TRINITY_DN17960_c0_g1_i1.p1 TRINITY_DN17960_c0_g1~~TRINITY_DN17960_c0_g1_i1.p1  ORF type:complete len:762 (-),score=116.57 TRINITY_DN17960_c0_g1_i1:686-2971(-)